MGTNAKYNKGYHATPYGSLMDDEIIVNGDREYVIVYSRPQDRPLKPADIPRWESR